MLWGNLPWLVMGAGIVFGGVPSIFHYFDPSSANPFVLGWFASVFLIWLAGSYWLFARAGAETLIRHPGLLQPQLDNPALIKGIWVLAMVGGVVGIGMMTSGIFSSPSS